MKSRAPAIKKRYSRLVWDLDCLERFVELDVRLMTLEPVT